MEPQEKSALRRWFAGAGGSLRRIGAIQWLIFSGFGIVLAIMVGTGGLVLQFRDRTVDAAESELGNTAQLLSRHFEQQLVVLQRIHDEISTYAQAEGIDTSEAFERRMGWKFPWWSSGRTDFNFELGVSFKTDDAFYNYKVQDVGFTDREGISIFCKDKRGDVFHTYSCYARGIEVVNGAYAFMDMLPKGRDEGEHPQSWVRYHDRYDD